VALRLYAAADIEELQARLADIAPLRTQPLLRVEQLLVDTQWRTPEQLSYSREALQTVCRETCGGLGTLVSSLRTHKDLVEGARLASRIFNLAVSASFSRFRGRSLLIDSQTEQIVGWRRQPLVDYPFAANLAAALAVKSWELRFATYGARELTLWFTRRRSPTYEVRDVRGRTHRLVAGRIFRVSDCGHYYTRGGTAILRASPTSLGFAAYGLTALTDAQPRQHTANEYVKIALRALRQMEDRDPRRINVTLARLATTPLFAGVGTPREYSQRARRLAYQLRTKLPETLVTELLERSLLRQLDTNAPAHLRKLPVTSTAQWPAVAGTRRFDLLNALLRVQGRQCCDTYRWRLAYAANAMLLGSNQVLFSGRNNKHG